MRLHVRVERTYLFRKGAIQSRDDLLQNGFDLILEDDDDLPEEVRGDLACGNGFDEDCYKDGLVELGQAYTFSCQYLCNATISKLVRLYISFELVPQPDYRSCSACAFCTLFDQETQQDNTETTTALPRF